MGNIDSREKIRRYLLGAIEPDTELKLQIALSKYLKFYYTKAEFRVDIAGNKLTKTQAGLNKKVNKRKSWHDLEIYNPNGDYCGLCMELKKMKSPHPLVRKKDATKRLIVGYTKINKIEIPIRENKKRKKGDWYNHHIENQAINAYKMRELGRAAGFAKGLRNSLMIIEGYFNADWQLMEQGFQTHILPYNFQTLLYH